LHAGVVVVLALVTALLAPIVRVAPSREQMARFDAQFRTFVELREAGAFGTGGFGDNKPVGARAFSVRHP
jgi:hypothetical protein